jgi:hypothetical protein
VDALNSAHNPKEQSIFSLSKAVYEKATPIIECPCKGHVTIILYLFKTPSFTNQKVITMKVLDRKEPQ